jgi:hypothetical protein
MPPMSKRPGLLLLCMLGLAAASAGATETAAPKPGQVVGYANADRSGAAQVWALPDDKPYLYVPSIPAHLGGALARVETGAEVSVALFQGPYFTARDQGCMPVLGAPGRPDMAWLGATAHFMPAPPGQPQPAAGATADSRYASMILFRADLGPPPGVLLLERRPTVGLHCTNPVHSTLYSRIFVPIAEAPTKTRCFELVGNYPSGGDSGAGKAFALDFLGAERAVLLAPGDMAARYADIQHHVTVTLFDGLSCKGAPLTLNSRTDARGNLRLVQAGYRGSVRSVRLVYEGGNAKAFMATQETLAEVPQAQPPAPEPAPAAPSVATSVATSHEDGNGTELNQSAAAAPAQTTEVPQTVTVSAAPASVPTVAPPAAPKADGPSPAARPNSGVERLGVEPLADGLLRTPAAKVAAFGAASTDAGGTKTFAYPVQDLYRLNHCLYWQKDCGAAAAQAWCQAKGFATAVEWRIDKGIGTSFPTLVMGEKKICASAQCDGFRSITCGP